MSTNQLVEEGLAVGIIAAQSIGEPGTQLTMRTFHTGGVATGSLHRERHQGDQRRHRRAPRHQRRRRQGRRRPQAPRRPEAQRRNRRRSTPRAASSRSTRCPTARPCCVADGEKVKPRQQLVVWDPHITPILAEKGGTVRYEDIEEGETVRLEEERKGGTAARPSSSSSSTRASATPASPSKARDGKILDFHYLPAKARIEVTDGQKIEAGQLLARQPREAAGTMDITGGLPRVTEIFEARKPKDPAVLAEISGTVELRSDKRRGKMTIIVKNESGMEKEHHVPQDKELQVHAGDYVEAGDPLIRGPIIPHDILRIKGEESLYQYLLTEVQNVYRSQGVKINDKHIEIILNQMLRKVKVEDAGRHQVPARRGASTSSASARATTRSRQSVQVAEPGGTDFKEGDVVLKRRVQGGQRGRRGRGQGPGQGQEAQAGPRQDAAAGHHQGVAAERVVHLRRAASRRRPRC